MSSIERPCDKVTRHSESNTERRILGMSKEGRGYAMGDRRIFFFQMHVPKEQKFLRTFKWNKHGRMNGPAQTLGAV